MTDYKIEKGVPLPKAKARSKYPWPGMKAGDSVLISHNEAESARTSARYYARKYGSRFVTRRETAGLRFWRMV